MAAKSHTLPAGENSSAELHDTRQGQLVESLSADTSYSWIEVAQTFAMLKQCVESYRDNVKKLPFSFHLLLKATQLVNDQGQCDCSP